MHRFPVMLSPASHRSYIFYCNTHNTKACSVCHYCLAQQSILFHLPYRMISIFFCHLKITQNRQVAIGEKGPGMYLMAFFVCLVIYLHILRHKMRDWIALWLYSSSGSGYIVPLPCEILKINPFILSFSFSHGEEIHNCNYRDWVTLFYYNFYYLPHISK